MAGFDTELIPARPKAHSVALLRSLLGVPRARGGNRCFWLARDPTRPAKAAPVRRDSEHTRVDTVGGVHGRNNALLGWWHFGTHDVPTSNRVMITSDGSVIQQYLGVGGNLVAFNELITASPVVLFLGAGASAAVGKPTMAQFVARLRNSISMDRGGHLLRLLMTARGDDLENILGDLEVFLSLPYLAGVQCDSTYATANDGNDETTPITPITITRAEAARLRSTIRHEIIREYRSIDRDAIVAAFEPLLDLVFRYVDGARYCLPIFTTNYDLAIETLCAAMGSKYNLEDGLELDPLAKTAYWNRKQFDHYRLTGYGDRHLVQFKLHGSVDWIRSEKSGRIVRAPAMYDLLDYDEFQNVIIYPAGNKAADREPYFSAFEYFSSCCERAKMLIVVGYCFRDYDALNRLLGARERNDELKIVLVSPDAYGLSIDIFHAHDWYGVDSVAVYFGNSSQQPEYLERIEGALKRMESVAAEAG